MSFTAVYFEYRLQLRLRICRALLHKKELSLRQSFICELNSTRSFHMVFRNYLTKLYPELKDTFLLVS